MNTTISYPNMLSIKKAAEQFGISQYFLRNLCRSGKVRFVRVGNRWLVNVDSLSKYFNEGDNPAVSEKCHA